MTTETFLIYLGYVLAGSMFILTILFLLILKNQNKMGIYTDKYNDHLIAIEIAEHQFNHDRNTETATKLSNLKFNEFRTDYREIFSPEYIAHKEAEAEKTIRARMKEDRSDPDLMDKMIKYSYKLKPVWIMNDPKCDRLEVFISWEASPILEES